MYSFFKIRFNFLNVADIYFCLSWVWKPVFILFILISPTFSLILYLLLWKLWWKNIFKVKSFFLVMVSCINYLNKIIIVAMYVFQIFFCIIVFNITFPPSLALIIFFCYKVRKCKYVLHFFKPCCLIFFLQKSHSHFFFKVHENQNEFLN